MKPAYFEICRDALLVSPRLVKTAIETGVDQLQQRSHDPRERFTATQWLEDHFGLDPGQVERAWVEEVHSGTATRSRLHVQYSNTGSAPPGPESIFLKSRAPDFGAALFGKLFELGRNEVAFYRELRGDVGIRAPRVYHCEGDSRNYMMLLEDLTDKGCQFRTLADKSSYQDARAVLTTLARLHAPFWRSARFDSDLAWVNRLETNRDARLLNLVRQLSVPIAYNRFAAVLPPEIRTAIPILLDKYPRLEEEWAREPRTLLHGDAHLGNMYFQDGEAGLLDWQVMQHGQGMRDVTYFLVNSTNTELRREHQEELIRHYLAELKQQGVELDFDTAWRQYRLQSVYAWIAGVVTAPSNFQDEAVVVSGLTRACNAVLDLDAVELIRKL